jgi:hypothetical protein
MAKLLGPDFLNLQVRDLAASRAFYTEVLGLTEDTSFTAPGVVLFESTTIPFALSEPKVNLDEAPHPGWGGRPGSTAIVSMSCMPKWKRKVPLLSSNPSMVRSGAPSFLLIPMDTELPPTRTPGIVFL